MKKLLIFLLSVLLLLSVGFAFGCTQPDEDFTQEEEVVLDTFELNYSKLTLEKHEEITLTALFNNKVVADDVTWASLNSNATVEDGFVEAKSEGNAIITATYGSLTAKCQIIITDNKLIPGLETNVSNKQLYLYPGDIFTLDNSISYNGKTLDISINQTLTGNAVTLNNNVITAVTEGDAQIKLTANWKGFSIDENIIIKVIPYVDIKIYDGTEAVIANDSRAGATSFTLTPSFIEEEVLLNSNQYEIQEFIYDSNVISVDPDTLVVTGLHKGTTDLKVVFKSLVSGKIADITLPVTVNIYNHDKTSSVTLADIVYLNTETYTIYTNEVYADLGASVDFDTMVIDTVVDVTNPLSPISLPVNNNKINIAGALENGLDTGARKWQIECGDISYIVNVNVANKDEIAAKLEGKYTTPDSAICVYDFVIGYNENGNSIISFVDDEGNVIDFGNITFYKFAQHEDQGYFYSNMVNTKVFTTQSKYQNREIMGFYFKSYNFYQFYIEYQGETVWSDSYCKFVSEVENASSLVAGTYTLDNTTYVLNEDLTCSNSANESGTYTVKHTSGFGGEIVMTIGSSTINATYTLSKGGNTLTIDGNVLTTANYNADYDTYAGFYENTWIVNTIFLQDGTMIFRPARWNWEGGSVSFADFTLENGIIDLMFKKAYSGGLGFEGVYQVDAGVYTITITNIEGGQTFTLVNPY